MGLHLGIRIRAHSGKVAEGGVKNSGDLNNKHLTKRNILTNFYSFAIKMPGNSLYYLGNGLKSKQKVCYSSPQSCNLRPE